MDLIANGIGEATRGVPRRTVLIGHNSTELKQKILGHFARDNMEALQSRLTNEQDARKKDMIAQNEII